MVSGMEKAPLLSAMVVKVSAIGRMPGTALLGPPAMLAPVAAGLDPRVTVIVSVSPARNPLPEKMKVSPGPTVPSETAA
jgi:hypothetical protein